MHVSSKNIQAHPSTKNVQKRILYSGKVLVSLRQLGIYERVSEGLFVTPSMSHVRGTEDYIVYYNYIVYYSIIIV